MKTISNFLHEYKRNSKLIRNSLNNPLKKPENIPQKDELEKGFYDQLAQKYIDDFDTEIFLYDENEEFPLSHQYFYSLLENISGKRILDCCCGYGFTSVKCAKRGATVQGVDISPKMIQLSQMNANLNHVTKQTNFKIMSVQDLKFDDNSFDFAVGLGALHHLNLELAGREISRILKPGGTAIFVEPRLPFRWLVALRSLFPNKCYESPGGSQLEDKDIIEFGKFFTSFKVHHFLFLRKLTRFPVIKKFSPQLDKYDLFLINKFPFLKTFYFSFVLEFKK